MKWPWQLDFHLRKHTSVFPPDHDKKIMDLEDAITKGKDGQIVEILQSVHPPDQGKRDTKRPRHDLIPVEFLDELASIFEEGSLKYGDSWKRGGSDFLTDCLNHASNHLHLYMNGDFSENQLAKVAWNCLAVRWHDLKKEKEEKK